MKTDIKPETLAMLRAPKVTRMDLVIEKLAESEEFWSLIKGYAGLVTPDLDHDGKLVGRDSFLADLTAEIEYQNERLDEDMKAGES